MGAKSEIIPVLLPFRRTDRDDEVNNCLKFIVVSSLRTEGELLCARNEKFFVVCIEARPQ